MIFCTVTWTERERLCLRRLVDDFEGTEAVAGDVWLGPEVIARQADVVPAEWRDVLEETVWNGGSRAAQIFRGASEIDGVPIDDRRGDEVEAGRAIALVFEGAVGEPPLLVQKDGLIEGMARLALVQTRVTSAS